MRQSIIERVSTIGDEDYFDLLGLPQDAPANEVQTAYTTLAKVWHPDRLAPQLFDVRDMAAKIFAKMSEARVTLTDPHKRATYIADPRRGERSAEIARVTNASLEFQKADVFMRKKNLAQAEAHARRAHEADPANADYLALLTWIEMEQDGPKAPRAAKHLAELERAVKLDERCERAHFYRGVLHKRMGKPDKAYLDFKAAAEINPKNIDAAREVLLYRKRTVHGST